MIQTLLYGHKQTISSTQLNTHHKSEFHENCAFDTKLFNTIKQCGIETKVYIFLHAPTSITLETRYGRVLFTLIFSVFSLILSFMACSSWVTLNTSLFMIYNIKSPNECIDLGTTYSYFSYRHFINGRVKYMVET